MSTESTPLAELPPIPAKRYFTIGEVSELCLVKPHVLRYWEQEFTQLSPVKRRGNRRYYQHHEVLLVRRIRELLYGEGFTIIGARGRLDEDANGNSPATRRRVLRTGTANAANAASPAHLGDVEQPAATVPSQMSSTALRAALLEIATLLDQTAPHKSN
jgi:DNA-binding transcriptional MerR regulator